VFVNQPLSEHPFLRTKSLAAGEVTEREIRRCTAAYYAMIESADQLFGEVLDTLKLVGQDIDDWIVIFASDHGEMLGEHGVWMKQKFYEASVKVPFFIRFPRQFSAKRITENVNLCDIFATLCELTGLPVPDGLDSRSLLPLLRGERRQWADKYQNKTISQYEGGCLMIKKDQLKYQYYGADLPEVLFDLAKDSLERRDFSQEPEYQAVMEQFQKERIELGF